MTDTVTVPVFPYVSFDDTLAFYRALGFRVTHDQRKPYVYGAVQLGTVHVHFHGARKADTPHGFSSCLVMVPNVAPVHRRFADGLRAAFGKIPLVGLPRITRLRKGQTRFTVYDPSGNSLAFINHDEPDIDYEAGGQAQSKLGLAIENAAFLRDTFHNDKAAAKVLDTALGKAGGAADLLDLARALAARAELAVALNDPDRARAARDELERLPLAAKDRRRLRAELNAAADLERWREQR